MPRLQDTAYPRLKSVTRCSSRRSKMVAPRST